MTSFTTNGSAYSTPIRWPKYLHCVVMRMTAFPVRQNHGFRPRGPDFFCQRKTIFDGCGEARIAEIQPLAKSGPDHGPCGFGFFRPNFGRAAGSHFTFGEVKDAYRV